MNAHHPLLAACLVLGFTLAACDSGPGNLVTGQGRGVQALPPTQLPRFVNTLGIEFVLIPAGTFLMGQDSASGGFPDEGPVHACRISRPFYISRHEITQAQWEVVMGTNPSYYKNGTLPDAPSALNFKITKNFGGESNPVENVSWDEVQEFIRELNRREGTNRYQLPTEAQWEYSARAGGAGPVEAMQHPSRWPSMIVWFNDGTRSMPMPVGMQEPNAWGLYDVEGNVREWCQDVYSPDYYAVSPGVDPGGPEAGDMKVNRGGSWFDPMNLRLVERSFNQRTHRSPFIGFRLVRETD